MGIQIKGIVTKSLLEQYGIRSDENGDDEERITENEEYRFLETREDQV